MVFVVIYGEAAALLGLVLPGETILLAGGVAAALGETNIVWLIVGASVAAVLGDWTGYSIGRRSGGRITETRFGGWVGRERWQKAEELIRHGGVATVIGARWIGYVRTVTPFVAGMSKMPTRQYVLANVAGGVVWVTVVCIIGYAVGETVGATVMFYLAFGAGALMLLYFAARWWQHRRRSQKAAASAE